MAAELSAAMGYLSSADVMRVEHLLARARLPVAGPALGGDKYLDLMKHDKKVDDGCLRLVLLKSIGQAVVSDAATEMQIVNAIESRVSHA